MDVNQVSHREVTGLFLLDCRGVGLLLNGYKKGINWEEGFYVVNCGCFPSSFIGFTSSFWKSFSEICISERNSHH